MAMTHADGTEADTPADGTRRFRKFPMRRTRRRTAQGCHRVETHGSGDALHFERRRHAHSVGEPDSVHAELVHRLRVCTGVRAHMRAVCPVHALVVHTL